MNWIGIFSVRLSIAAQPWNLTVFVLYQVSSLAQMDTSLLVFFPHTPTHSHNSLPTWSDGKYAAPEVQEHSISMLS